jgi:crossover junction endodeoxyribonuclease RuvC
MTTRILGIDPGYGILGWGVIEKDLRVVEFGVITTPPGTAIESRLFLIHRELQDIITRLAPDSAALEKLFFAKNTTTAFDVAKAVGAVYLTLAMNEIPFSEYTPPQVKQAVTGYGRASKGQMQQMIMKIFGLSALPSPDDAADALAVAACHSLCGPMVAAVKHACIIPS